MLKDDIVDGIDELGVLLMGHAARRLLVRLAAVRSSEARALAPAQQRHQPAGDGAGVLAGVVWAMRNPRARRRSIPTTCPSTRSWTLCRPYLGEMVGRIQRLDAAGGPRPAVRRRTSTAAIPGSSRTSASSEAAPRLSIRPLCCDLSTPPPMAWSTNCCVTVRCGGRDRGGRDETTRHPQSCCRPSRSAQPGGLRHRAQAAFSWDSACGTNWPALPGGGINIAFEAVDRHLTGPLRTGSLSAGSARRRRGASITYAELARADQPLRQRAARAWAWQRATACSCCAGACPSSTSRCSAR
ncbi:MAG: hypothetical protein MZW92_76870 [Comamonadaceae bacterium]|nr:hypothetical protein [Comamonadaceae bacterium]